MSAYKVVSGNVAITSADLILRTLETMGFNVQQNAMCEQRWSGHNQEADFVVKQNELPEYLQGFGDLGLVKTGDRYSFLAISKEDSHYIDNSKVSDLVAQGMSMEEARRQQPTGKFQRDQAEFLQNIETGYSMFETVQSIQEKCQDAQFESPTGVEGEETSWMTRGSVTKRDLSQLGVTVGV
jgi:hypothetical protein